MKIIIILCDINNNVLLKYIVVKQVMLLDLIGFSKTNDLTCLTIKTFRKALVNLMDLLNESS